MVSIKNIGTGGASVQNRASFIVFQKTVTTAGTAVQLTAQAIPDGFKAVVKAKAGNTGTIEIGNSQANAQDAAIAFKLAAGQAVSLAVTNTSLIWIDATVDGEGVEVIVER